MSLHGPGGFAPRTPLHARRGSLAVVRSLSAVAAVWITAVVPAAAQTARQPTSSRPTLLDVPYVPQTDVLCGGAAAAMVMRYWGAHDVDASAFASLVNPAAHGIRTDALVAALRKQSWSAVAGDATDQDVRRELARGRPVIALIASGRNRFHYVVIVSWTGGKLVLHDPARAPFRVVDEKHFENAWRQSNRWMLIVLPPASGTGDRGPGTGNRGPGSGEGTEEDGGGPCAEQVRAAVRLAQAGDHASARATLESAAEACPSASSVWRELAGEDVLASNWTSAADHARRALSLDADDEQAWRILATSQYLERHDRDALAAWNRLGEPRLDLIDVRGLKRTRYSIAADAVGIDKGMPITNAALDLARRRLRDVPSIAAASVSYKPLDEGRAQVDAAVVERDAAPSAYPAWIAMGLDAAVDRESTASFASLTGGGELASVTWRWWEHRPMVAGSFSAPAPRAIGGTWRLEAARETQTFGSAALVETRTHAGLFADKWIASPLKVGGGLSIEEWQRGPRMAAASARLEIHAADDRLVAHGGASIFAGNSAPFQTLDASTRWRSRVAPIGRVWSADAGLSLVTRDAPASLWPGAGTGRARPVLLRAHPLLSDGIITGEVFGRRLMFANGEVDQWMRPSKWPLQIAPAAFVDLARASRGFTKNGSRMGLDAGCGLRIALPAAGTFRIDFAHGLRDGRSALSAAWTANW